MLWVPFLHHTETNAKVVGDAITIVVVDAHVPRVSLHLQLVVINSVGTALTLARTRISISSNISRVTTPWVTMWNLNSKMCHHLHPHHNIMAIVDVYHTSSNKGAINSSHSNIIPLIEVVDIGDTTHLQFIIIMYDDLYALNSHVLTCSLPKGYLFIGQLARTIHPN